MDDIPFGVLPALGRRQPVVYVANRGQWDPSVAYRVDGSGGTVWFTSEGAYLAVYSQDAPVTPDRDLTDGEQVDPSQAGEIDYVMVRTRFVGSRSVTPVAEGASVGRYNYFSGDISGSWLRDIPGFGSILYPGVYPGIDVRYYSRQRNVEYDFLVSAGADVSAIRIALDGADSVSLSQSGDLVISTAWGEIVHHHPVVYQQVGNLRHDIAAQYTLSAGGEVGFNLTGDYHPTLPLVIDPVLSFSTYLGGGASSAAYAVDYDDAGGIYVAGVTASMDFPDTNAYQGTMGGGDWDAFVAKYGDNGETIEYASYLGGALSDYAYGLAVGDDGSAYIVGRTFSTDFPTVSPIYPADSAGDAFVTKLSPDGSSLTYSTYVGGSGSDLAWAAAVDGSDQLYVAGYTLSEDFPTAGGVQDTLAGSYDVVVFKVNASGTGLSYSTYLGGEQVDIAQAIAVDGSSRAVVTGYTNSTDFPTAGAYQSSLASNTGPDMFISKLNGAGGVLTYSTYLGGASPDFADDIALGTDNSMYVAGRSLSTNFPREAALQNSLNGPSDMAIAKLNAQGNTLLFGTYLGGEGDEFAGGIAVDDTGRVFIVGRTGSTDFPNVSASQDTYGGGPGDAVVLRINAALDQIDYSTFLGGDSTDEAYAVAVNNDSYVYVAGQTVSADFPLKRPLQSSLGGAADAFVALVTGDCVDTDEDTVCDSVDNCPEVANPLQEDNDGDDVGDSCDVCPNDPLDDADGDGFCADEDNCPETFNPDQADPDTDGVGTVCDNCADDFNPLQEDEDLDDIGDSCDICPLDFFNDFDGDGICGDVDNCPGTFNPLQEDLDSNGVGDACEGCCVGLTGNVDCGAEEEPSLGDLTSLIDHLFVSFQPLCCQAEANMDGSANGDVSLGDLTALIDHLFVSFDPLPPCL